MSLTKLARAAILGAAAAALLALPAAAQAEKKLTYQGNKARISVGRIKTKAPQCSDETAASVGEMLSTALANNEKFVVLASQEEVAELREEIDLGESGDVEEGAGPDRGVMEGADLLVTGAVTAFEPDAGGKSGGLAALTRKVAGGVGLSTKKAEIGLDIKLVDVRTRRVIFAEPIEAKSSSWGADIGGAGWVKDVGLSGGMGEYKNSPMEKAVRAALAKTVERIAQQVPEEYYRYKGGGQYAQQYRGEPARAGGAAAAAAAGGGAAQESAPAPRADVSENMALYTKYDFVPGDRVLFYDDLSGDEVGEFPRRWELIEGVFEVARFGNEPWIMCTNDGYLRPKMKGGPLPEKYTVEMDFWSNGPDESGHYYYFIWGGGGDEIAEFCLWAGSRTEFVIAGKSLASKNLPHELGKGKHTLRVSYASGSFKAYVDNEKVANIPEVIGFKPDGLTVRIRSNGTLINNPLLFKNFRFAEGGKSLKDQLAATGRIVTHGILFDSGSARIKGESYKTLAQIGDLLTSDPALKLSIEGHTDGDGTAEANMALSQERADSVKAYLQGTYGIDPARLQTKGFGESKPIDSNDTAEGKANNRRVELVKL